MSEEKSVYVCYVDTTFVVLAKDEAEARMKALHQLQEYMDAGGFIEWLVEKE